MIWDVYIKSLYPEPFCAKRDLLGPPSARAHSDRGINMNWFHTRSCTYVCALLMYARCISDDDDDNILRDEVPHVGRCWFGSEIPACYLVLHVRSLLLSVQSDIYDLSSFSPQL
jgi:hypothetical protein